MRIALVTGASRGAGRGIACALGEAGFTVYVTGRSVRGGATTDGMAGTIDDTADEVTRRGGRGVAVRCDHRDDAQVAALFARVREEQGGLDLLVNNCWGGYEGHGALPMKPFWELGMDKWDGMFEAGLRALLVSSQLAAPLLLARGNALVVNTIAWASDAYLGHLLYDVAKAAIVRATQGLARELQPRGVAAVALAPGFMRTERVLAAPATDWPGGKQDLTITESPEYVGRAVRALAADSRVMERTGRVLTAGALAREYGFTDIDGRQPAPFEL
jgi:NAD(P)-dependent dehydrogenase (short-subunit alcohol dehydrogenase family)